MRSGWVLVVVLGAAACGRSSKPKDDDEAICQRMTTLCPERVTKCFTADDWREMREDLGDKPVQAFRACVLAAEDCDARERCYGAALALIDDATLPVPAPDAAPAPSSVDAAAAPPASRPALRFDRVVATTAPTSFGHELSVAIEVTVTGDMPAVAPTVTVDARCDGATDRTDHGFFQSLDGAQVGDQRTDTIALFSGSALAAPPARCDLTLGVTAGATPLAHYCLQGGATTAGACPP